MTKTEASQAPETPPAGSPAAEEKATPQALPDAALEEVAGGAAALGTETDGWKQFSWS